MAEIEKKPVKITETVLRDAHQSLIATRMTTEQMLPIVDKMDKDVYKRQVYEYQEVRKAIKDPDKVVIFSTSPSVRVGLEIGRASCRERV